MQRPQPQDIDQAYRHCWQIATTHYENFTVGSWLLPRRLRQHIAAIYAFARGADDFADEGTLSAAERLARLLAWERELEACYAGRATHPVFIALAQTVQRFAIPADPFRQLLDAFRQDVEFRPFATFAALHDYCRRSANPVGHLVLYLFGYRDAERQALADQICTGLQLVNFWQDLAVDAGKDRVYVPEEDLQRFGCSAADIAKGQVTPRLRQLLAFEVERARVMLVTGERLASRVNRQLAREVRLFACAGQAIVQKLEAAGYDVFTRRPTVSKWTKVALVIRALVSGPRDGRLSAMSLDTTPANPSIQRHSMPAQEGPARDERTKAMEVEAKPFAPSSRPPLAYRGVRLLARIDGLFQRGEPVQKKEPIQRTTATALRDAYAYCEQLTRRSSSNFAYAFRLLGPERRHALHAVYAFCRFVDDIADDAEQRAPAHLLARWREELARVYDGTPTHPIGQALADAVRRFHLSQQHFADLMRGVEMDLTRSRYATFDELHQYCYRVASTVGLLCIEIFGYQDAGARDYAVDLGVAFQLTNILRDVLEDARRDRIYLPLEDLGRFDCTEEELLRGRYSPRLGALMAFECGRARAYYLRARGALSPADRGSLAAAEAMRLIYERLLDRIEARHFDVFGPKVTLPRYEKITLAMAAWGRSQLAVLVS